MNNGFFKKIAIAAALLACSATAFASTPSTVSTANLFTAISALQRNDLNEAYKALDQIEMTAPEYQIAFLEMQKVHYRQKNWDKFFGYATYYRKNMLKAAPNVHHMLLEILALSKHCQYDAAEKIFAAASEYVTKDYLSQYKAIADILNLQRELDGHVRTSPVKAPFEVLTPTVHWYIPEANRAALMSGAVKSPRGIRVVVKSACKDQNSHEELTDIQIATGVQQ